MERDVLEARVRRGCRKEHSSHLRNGCGYFQPLVPAEKGRCRRCSRGFSAHARQPWRSHLALFLPAAHLSAHVVAWEKMRWLIAVRLFLLGLGPPPKAGLEEEMARGKQEPTAQDKAFSSLPGPQLRGTKGHTMPGFHPSTFPLVNPQDISLFLLSVSIALSDSLLQKK